MKTIFISIAACGLLGGLALAQPPRYSIIDLGTLPSGTFSQGGGTSNRGVVAGVASLADGTQHSVLWYLNLGLRTDIGTGLPGNNASFGINDRGEVAIQAEGSAHDPNNENFCGYSTGLKCV